MKSLKSIAAFAIAALAISATAHAQQIKIATGSPKGTYHALYTNIAERCGTEMAVVGVNTSGSLENLDKLAGKEVGAAFMQTDALFATAQGRDLSNIKTLVAFNKESVHVVASATASVKVEGSGFLGLNQATKTLNTVDDLSGYKVAAAGGSIVTAQLIKMQGQVNWIIVPVDTPDAALAAVKSGAVQAALLVGGQPLGNIRALGNEFKLLGFKPATVDLLKTVYVPDRLSYPKLSQGAVQSVATEALLVVRTMNTKDRLAALSKFRSCVIRNIPEWQDADGSHPAWAQVDPDNKGKWQWYDLPAAK